MENLISLIREILVAVETIQKTSQNKKEVKYDTQKAGDNWKLIQTALEDKSSTNIIKFKEKYLHPGKIHIFTYDAIGSAELELYDKHPIVLSIGQITTSQGQREIGLNLSWWPKAARVYLIKEFYKIYNSKIREETRKSPKNAKNQLPLYVDLYALKLKFDQYGLSFALRQYDLSRVKNDIIQICYEDSEIALNLDIPGVFPQLQGKNKDLQKIYRSFEKVIVKYRSTKPMELKKLELMKKKNKYLFIKR